MMASDRAKEKAHRSELLSKGVEIHGLKRFVLHASTNEFCRGEKCAGSRQCSTPIREDKCKNYTKIINKPPIVAAAERYCPAE